MLEEFEMTWKAGEVIGWEDRGIAKAAVINVSSVIDLDAFVDEEDLDDPRSIISQSTINTIYTCMLPLSIMMILYASLVCFRRRYCLKTKQVRAFSL